MRSPMNEKMKLILAAAIAACTSLTAAAGDKVGKGADAFVCYDKGHVGNPTRRLSVELFDIYEAKNDIQGKMPPVFDPSVATVEQALAELARRVAVNDPVRAASLLTEATLILNDLERDAAGPEQGKNNTIARFAKGRLRDIPDSHELEIPENCQLEQLVIQDPETLPDRIKLRYLFRKDYWDRLSPVEQAATLWHEAIYRETSNQYGHTDSRRTRRLNAYAFNGAVEAMTRCQYRQHLNLLGIPKFIYSDFVTVVTDPSKQRVKCDESGEIRQVEGVFRLSFANELKSSIDVIDPEFDASGEFQRAASSSTLRFYENGLIRQGQLQEVIATGNGWQFPNVSKKPDSGLIQLKLDSQLRVIEKSETGAWTDAISPQLQNTISKFFACGRDAFKGRKTSAQRVEAYIKMKGAIVNALGAKDFDSAAQIANSCETEMSRIGGKRLIDEKAIEEVWHDKLVDRIVDKVANCKGVVAGVEAGLLVTAGFGWQSLLCRYSDGTGERILKPNLSLKIMAGGVHVMAVKVDGWVAPEGRAAEGHDLVFVTLGYGTKIEHPWSGETRRKGFGLGLFGSMEGADIGPRIRIRTKKLSTDDSELTQILLSEVVTAVP